MKAVPLHPHDQIGFPAAVLEKPVPRLGTAVAAIGDAYLARDRRAMGQGFGALAISQFQVRKAASSKIVDAMHAPVRAFAAGLGDTSAVGQAYGPVRPVQALAGRRRCQQLIGDGLEKIHRVVEAVFDGGIGQVGQVQYPPLIWYSCLLYTSDAADE